MKTVTSKPTANALTQQALRVLSMKGWAVWRNNSTGIFDQKKGVWRKSHGIKGSSDIIGYNRSNPNYAPCTFIAVEIKVGADKLSIWQEAFLEAVRKAGGVAIVLRSLDDLNQVA